MRLNLTSRLTRRKKSYVENRNTQSVGGWRRLERDYVEFLKRTKENRNVEVNLSSLVFGAVFWFAGGC